MSNKKLVVMVGAIVVVALSLVLGTVSAQDQYFPVADLSNPAAPFIFSYDVAIAKGATAEWRKQESVVLDEANMKMYMAVTRVRDGMADTEGDIQLTENRCGVVYVGDMSEDWNITELKPLIVGGPYDEATETCDANNMSEPDNLFVDANGDLWIYEDTDLHANNMVWKYVVATGELIRFANLPLGSEATGLRILADGTLLLNIQNPDGTNPAPYNFATVGVVNGFKATDMFESVALPSEDQVGMLTLAMGEYQVLGTAGTQMPGDADTWGAYNNMNGDVMQGEDGAFCNDPDGNMFISTSEDDSTGILYTNWECAPGGVSRIELARAEDGSWVASNGYRVDFASVRGTIYNCNASVTPWNTGLTSEEDAVLDAETWYGDGYDVVMNDYVGGIANPYDYGYITELIPNEDGSTSLVKHYAMGRRENEQAWVAPDQKTVYFGDDGTDKPFYKFVATNAGDLSAGTLYAAKLTQTGNDTVSDYAFGIEWIELGSGDNATIEAAIRALDAGM